MLKGTVWDKMLKFALPLAASSILQQLFNAADVAVVGRFAGNEALAAVGANGAVINLLVNLFVGLSVGANAVISVCLGQKNEERIKKAVHTAVLVAALSGIFLLVIGQLFAGVILEAMSTPKDIIGSAESYFRIYFLGMPFIMLYNFSAAILRSKGDTKRPLLALLVSGMTNVVLNLIFVVGFHMAVSGVAAATAISNIFSSGILLYFLAHEEGSLKLNLKELRIDKNSLAQISRIGVPAGVQGMVFSLSNVCIQSALNGLGSLYVAAGTAALNFEYIAYFVLNSFNQASVTFIGQNYGAKNYARCRQVTRWAIFLGAVSTSAVSLVFVVFRGSLIHIFTPDADVARIACQRMVIILSFEFLNMLIDVLSGTLRGLGHSAVPAFICGGGICGVRILYLYTLYPMIASFKNLMLIYPVSWVVTVLVLGAMYLKISRKVYGANG